ncbi:hypothetical protein G4B88_023657 [Cannabis sativa]|uniref:Uncharacterized protein n=1 Tax=Cannabis sativa TaxID=3483 RepID=A0A7J6HV24_CANSA|nr:hypothetical protein G4B88_023657 [Cannabis sativa]
MESFQCILRQSKQDFFEHHIARLLMSLSSPQKLLKNSEKEWNCDEDFFKYCCFCLFCFIKHGFQYQMYCWFLANLLLYYVSLIISYLINSLGL